MLSLNWVDYVIVGLFFISILAGLMRGLVKEMIGLLTWLVAFTVATLFSSRLALLFSGAGSDHSGNVPSLFAISISFVAIFVGVLIIGRFFNYFVSSAVEGTGISFTNRLLGALFGAARGFLVATLFVFLIGLTPIAKEPYWTGSQFVASFQPVVLWIQENVQPGLEELKAKVGSMRDADARAGSHNTFVFDNS